MRLSTASSATLKIVSLFLLSSCGLTINHQVSGSINIDLNLEKLADYFVPVCLEENPAATQEELDTCVKLKVGYFLQTVILEGTNEEED